MLNIDEFTAMVDHTLLKPEATADQIEQLCRDAVELAMFAVCVNGYWVPRVVALLTGTPVRTCSVVGFPLGAMDPRALATEVTIAVTAGAAEIDMVIPVGLVQAEATTEVSHYIDRARAAAGDDVILKVILETALLTDPQITRSCQLAVDAGADFVKTSTGFNAAGGATVDAVALMRRAVGADVGVKASGGIRTLDQVEAMVAAGASRLGMSAAPDVVSQIRAAT
ncbi:MAG: deoxyribose-phosphate aldolase [Actinomycetota bacterium]